jgi:hypothetical protein
MVHDPERDPFEPAPGTERRCAVCPHFETQHVVRDVVNTLERRPYCLECDDWHEFVPSPQDA